ncbi:MAG: BrnA antitoxin family protein [Treponema sp.]|jgi:uncharacterized protein (DUF4415 family)|nr:BrnA antitoxin family protein [Treponema sp.]
MAMVRVTASALDPISEESRARLAALKDRSVDTSDIPELTSEQLAEMRRQMVEKRKKRMFSLRLTNATISWWQSLGEGYTGIMARLLEEAPRHPEWIKACL